MGQRIDLDDAFATIDAPWQPRIAAQVDDFAGKLAKIEGEFVWHHHDDADELFWIHRGRLVLRFRDRDDVELRPGQLYVVPRGVEHLPVADVGTELIMLERADVVNTGSAGGERTAPARPLGA